MTSVDLISVSGLGPRKSSLGITVFGAAALEEQRAE